MRDDICTTIDNFCDNFLAHIHIIILFYLSITLIFVLISIFLCKSMVSCSNNTLFFYEPNWIAYHKIVIKYERVSI